jgi:hypothetical protein
MNREMFDILKDILTLIKHTKEDVRSIELQLAKMNWDEERRLKQDMADEVGE